MAEFTQGQAAAWPGAVAEAQSYVTSSVINGDLEPPSWTLSWGEETRPGRGRSLDATWCDGEYFVQILIDVYGNPSVSVAEMSWLHNSSDEECDCAPCTADRAEELMRAPAAAALTESHQQQRHRTHRLNSSGATMSNAEPRVGQIWADNDPRSAGRTVEIIETGIARSATPDAPRGSSAGARRSASSSPPSASAASPSAATSASRRSAARPSSSPAASAPPGPGTSSSRT